MSAEIINILQRAHIDPRTVIAVTECSDNKCPWCNMKCGHVVKLSPCDHHICGECADSLVDSNNNNCPICLVAITDFTWQ